MHNFFDPARIALLMFAILAPLAYCSAQNEQSAASLERACIEARGEWMGFCKFPKPAGS